MAVIAGDAILVRLVVFLVLGMTPSLASTSPEQNDNSAGDRQKCCARTA